jgi:VWFA-related protein
MGNDLRNGVIAEVVLCLLALSGACVSQSRGTQAGQGQSVTPDAVQPVFMLRTYSRMVNVELVVKDAKGNHIPDLKASDFQVFEQTPARSGEKHEQKISEFREVHMATMAAPVPMQSEMPRGVYTNAVTQQKEPVPATILLVDGLNTDVQSQAQVHVQMIKMLRQLPTNVPVAVFLLGDRLKILQSFTTDPKLLQAALSNAISTAGIGLATVDPRDDDHSMGNEEAKLIGGMPTPGAGIAGNGPTIPPPPGGGGPGSTSSSHGADEDATFKQMIELAREFDQNIYSTQMEERVHRTIDALTSLGHNLAGYPGRKNLLWLSTTFPINLTPYGTLGSVTETTGVNDEWAGSDNYRSQLQQLNAVLSDSKIAVYPINIAGVQTMQEFRAEALPADHSAAGMQASRSRDLDVQAAAVDTMHAVADGTGGKVCTGDNDLGDCVRKAVDDSSEYYEISYYPDSSDWNGDFRNIIVKTGLKGAHLSYRQGYYANPEGSPDPKILSAEMQSDCEDYLDATAVDFKATQIPSDVEGQLKFAIQIDPAALTIPATADGGHQVNVAVAVCTYNDKDWAQTLMNYPVNVALDAKKYETVTTKGQLGVNIQIPAPKPPAIRVLVKDVATGKLGSVYIKTGDLVAEVPKPVEDPYAVFQ